MLEERKMPSWKSISCETLWCRIFCPDEGMIYPNMVARHMDYISEVCFTSQTLESYLQLITSGSEDESHDDDSAKEMSFSPKYFVQRAKS